MWRTAPESAIATTAHEVEVEGVPVHYRVAGTGPPVVLIHGLAGSGWWWSPTLPALLPHFQILLVDLPGFGGLRGHRFELSEAAAWLHAWMDAAGIARAHVAGHSMGGAIVVRLAARWPEMIDRLVLVAPVGMPSQRPMLGYAMPLLLAGGRARKGFLPKLARDSLRAGPGALWKTARAVLAEDVRADLPRITAPSLIVVGARDPLIPPATGELLRREIPDARLVVLPGAAHVPMEEQPEQFNATLTAFFERRPMSNTSIGLQGGPIIEILRLTLGAIFFQEDAFRLVVETPGGSVLAFIVLLLGALSDRIGQSVVLFANRVPPEQFVKTIVSSSFVFGAVTTVWVLTTWMVAVLVLDTPPNLFDIFVLVCLSHAPLFFGVFELLPYLGNPLYYMLRLWVLLLLIFALAVVYDIGVFEGLLCAGAGWVAVQFVTHLPFAKRWSARLVE